MGKAWLLGLALCVAGCASDQNLDSFVQTPDLSGLQSSVHETLVLRDTNQPTPRVSCAPSFLLIINAQTARARADYDPPTRPA